MLKIQKSIFLIAAAGFLAALIAGCEFDNEICSPTDSDLTISPSSVFLEAAKTNLVEFQANGGQSNYTWSMNNDDLGTLYLIPTNSAIALYQSTTNIGTNIITARDSSGDSANARIVQN